MAQSKSEEKEQTPEEYLIWEAKQEEKYEYENGKIIAMTGGTLPHSRIITNLAGIFNPRLRDTSCTSFVSDAKVLTPKGKFYYPDFVISCDKCDRLDLDYLQHPKMIIEVLSPNTESRDRRVKQQHYMLIDTLQTYVLITPEYPSVEIYQRQTNGRTWEYERYESIEDNCKIIFDISLADIYEKIV